MLIVPSEQSLILPHDASEVHCVTQSLASPKPLLASNLTIMANGIQNLGTLRQYLNGRRLQRGQFINKTTGEAFEALVVTESDGSHTFVGFSSKMGVLPTSEIVAGADSLQVVQLESGYHCLCRPGNNSWEDIVL